MEQKRLASAFRLMALLGLVLITLPLVHSGTLGAPPESASGESDLPADARRSLDGNEPATFEIDLLPEEAPSSSVSDVAGAPGQSNESSVRPRGIEAPVQLIRVVPAVAEEKEAAVDPGDGAPPQNRSRSRDTNSKSESKSDRGIRIWPMRADTYSFTQAFGCTQQIANFYFPDPGCPASAPVVHSGIDLAAPEGTPFYAAASGWVVDSGYDREVGVPNTRIIIQHDGRNDDYSTEYLHWIASYVEVGDYVEAGEMIGEVGSVGYSTGPHLHFSLVNLSTGEHADPLRWLPSEPGTEGYRGILPNARARTRLPAGTTAGLPESADPAPPPPPVRQDVPKSPPDAKGDRAKGKRDGKAGKERGAKEDRADRKASAASNVKDNAKTDQPPAKEKSKERTRKRERSKDGTSSETRDAGLDGKNQAPEETTRTSKRKDDSKERKSEDKNQNDQRQSNRNDKQQGKDNNKEEKKNDPAVDDGTISNGDDSAKGEADEDSGKDPGENDGADGKNGADGPDSGKDGDGAKGTDGGKGEDSQSGDGGNGGNGGDGGSGENGGDGGNGGSGGSGKTGGDGGNGGDGGSATGGQGGDGGSGGAGGDANDAE